MIMVQYIDLKIKFSSQYIDLKCKYVFFFRFIDLNEAKRGHMLSGFLILHYGEFNDCR